MAYSLSNVSHKFRDFVHQSEFVHQPSLVAQIVKNLPTVQETWVQTLGQEDPLEKGMATHSHNIAWRISLRGAWWSMVHGVAESDMTERQTRITELCKQFLDDRILSMV